MFNIVENISAFSTGKQEPAVICRNQNFLFVLFSDFKGYFYATRKFSNINTDFPFKGYDFENTCVK